MKLSLTSLSFSLAAAGVISFAPIENAHAEKVCMRLNNAGTRLVKRVVATGNCPRRFVQVVDTSVLTGPQGPSGEEGDQGEPGSAGPQGPVGDTGADGVIRIWGDGSGGALEIAGVQSLSGESLQRTTVNIQQGATLSVQSGSTIRATGQCNIAGTITVFVGSTGGSIRAISATTLSPSIVPAHPGRAYSAAANGEFGESTAVVRGGAGGDSIFAEEARHIATVGSSVLGGGGGGPGLGVGGAGGGIFALYCQGGITITNTGIINAQGGDGSNGGGGGAGGFLILASGTSIENLGSLDVQGGNGGSSTVGIGNGGGGGGGIVHALAPSVSIGTVTATSGIAGDNSTSATELRRFGGGGGGSLGGGGGRGGDVQTNDTVSGALSGSDGYSVVTEEDPSSLLL